MRASLGALGRRSVMRLARDPAPAAMTVAFPALFLVIAQGSLGSAAPLLQRFGVSSYLEFAIAGTLVLSAMAIGVNAGADLAVDLQAGVLDRLLLAPVPRGVVLVGAAAAPVALAALQATAYLVILGLGGTRVAAGALGGVVLVVLVAAVAATFFAVGAVIALRTGSAQVVLASFPAFFVLMTFSSFFLPRALIPSGWFRAVAAVNPISAFIEAGRGLVISGWDGGALLRGAVAAVVSLALGAEEAARALRDRARGVA